jgi:hypothetical protein
MLITKVSILTNVIHSIDIPMTEDQYERYVNRLSTGEKVQHIFPQLSNPEREFLINGITEAEWDDTFGSIADPFDDEKYVDENPR